MFGRMCRARAVALLTNNEQQSEIAVAFLEQLRCCMDHARDDSLRIARPTPSNEFVVFARAEIRGHGIHVSRQHHQRLLSELCIDVRSARLYFDLLRYSVMLLR